MFRKWGVLSQWPAFYHSFHDFNKMKEWPRWVWNIKDFISAIQYSLIFLMLPMFTYRSKETIVGDTMQKISSLFLSLEFMNLRTLSYFILIITIYNISIIFYVCTQKMEKAPSRIVLFCNIILHLVTPIILVITQSDLHVLIKRAFFGNVEVAALVSISLAFLLQYSLLIITYINTTKTIYGTTHASKVWDFQSKVALVTLGFITQQCWIFAYVFPNYGIFISEGINFFICIYSLLWCKDMNFMMPRSDSIVITFFIVSSCVTIFSAISAIVPYYEKLLIFLLFLVIIYVFAFGSTAVCRIFNNRLYKMFLSRTENEFSDDSDQYPDFSGLSVLNQKSILRLLVKMNYKDLGEIMMRLADITPHTEIAVECYRLLVMIGVTPAIVWKKIMDIKPTDVPFHSKQLLCDLQYEATRIEMPVDLTPYLNELDKYKQDVRKSLVKVVSYIIDQRGKNCINQLDDYADACEIYDINAKACVRNMPRAFPILNHYSDYLQKLRGEYTNAYYFARKADSLQLNPMSFLSAQSSGTSMVFKEPIHELGNGIQQQQTSQSVVNKIHSSWVYIFLCLASFLFLLFLVPIFKTFSWSNYLTFIPTEFYDHQNSPYYYVTTFESWQLRSLAIILGEDFSMNTTITKVYGNADLDKIMSYFRTVTQGTDYFLIISQPIPVQIGLHTVEMPIQILNNVYIAEIVDLIFRASKNPEEFCQYSDQFTQMNTAFENLMYFHDHFGTSSISTAYDKIRNSFIIYACVIFFVYLMISITTIICIPREQRRYFQVFAEIDIPSLEVFKNSLATQMKITSASHINTEDNEFALDLDEIELDEHDSLMQKISLIEEEDNFEGFDDSEQSKITKTNLEQCFFQSKGFFAITLGITLFIALILLGFSVHFSLYTSIDYIKVGHEISMIMQLISKIYYDASMFSYDVIMDTNNINYSMIEYEFVEYGNVEGISNFSQRLKMVSDEYIKWALGDSHDDVGERTVDLVSEIEKIVVDLYGHSSDLRSYDAKMQRVNEIISCLISGISIIVLVTVTARYYIRQEMRFRSLKCLLLLLPSKYFSTIAMLMSVINKKSSSKHTEEIIISLSILNHMKDPTIVFDSKLRVCSANKQALAIFSIPRNYKTSTTIDDIFPREKQPLFYQYINGMIGPHGVVAKRTVELVGRTSSCTEIPLSGTLNPLQTETQGLVIMLMMKDMTSSKQLLVQIDSAKRRVLALLRRLVPPRIAQQLMTANAHTQQLTPQCTLMLVSIDSIRHLCSVLDHVQVVDIVESCMCRVERKIRKYNGVVRLRTFGSRFMFASGLYERRSEKENVVEAVDFLKKAMKTITKHSLSFLESIQCTAVVHTGGPLLSGVIGKSRSVYDVWGDVVDEILKMGITIEGGKIYISKSSLEAAEVEPSGDPVFVVMGDPLWDIEASNL